jgi:hypothetical protein
MYDLDIKKENPIINTLDYLHIYGPVLIIKHMLNVFNNSQVFINSRKSE